MVWVSDFMKSLILDLQSMLSRLIIEGLSSLEESWCLYFISLYGKSITYNYFLNYSEEVDFLWFESIC